MVVWEPTVNADPWNQQLLSSSLRSLAFRNTRLYVHEHIFPHSPNLKTLSYGYYCLWSLSNTKRLMKNFETPIICIKYVLKLFFARCHKIAEPKLLPFLSVLFLVIISNISGTTANAFTRLKSNKLTISLQSQKQAFRGWLKSLFYFAFIFYTFFRVISVFNTWPAAHECFWGHHLC